ncbi:MAG TPA: ABC transporter permease, partial [Pyrinomonadaceae bacterium]|nr:ABC transporter permease [Pyrinomonadaceae bacterium]
TKPSIIFLDEPTSGLDPSTEEKIMKLFRQIAESGRTVIMTTHAMENVRLFDKIVVLMRGKLVFYGKPSEALEYLGAKSFKDLYEKLEKPVEDGVRTHGEENRKTLTEQSAENWKQKFLKTPQYQHNIQKPLAELGTLPPSGVRKKRRLGIFGAISQWFTLSRRYLEVLLKDKLNLFILLAQAPAIALLTFFVMGANQPRDFAYFVIALVAFWFGTSVSAREIIRERPVYKRERMVNLGILPYLASKFFVLGIIVGLQCILLFVPLKFFDLVGLMSMPGDLLGIPQFWAMLLTADVGIALGLLISALVRTSELATSLVPLVLIPQILFSGLVGVPSGINKVAGMLMPAAWSFDTMKRFSTLDTLESEGANPKGKTRGEGLYKSIESENQAMVDKFTTDLEEYKTAARAFQADPLNNPTPQEPELGTVKKIPDNLSGYVTFLHPWMNEVVNQIVLVLMFGMLVFVTLIVLRLQDLI